VKTNSAGLLSEREKILIIRWHFTIERVSASVLLAVFVLLLNDSSSARQQEAQEKNSSASLTVKLEDGKTVSLKASDLEKLPRQSVQVSDHGQRTTLTGIKLNLVLQLAGVTMGRQRGQSPERYLLVEATDNYRAVFALAEFDPDYTDQPVLLVDTRDGKPLSEKEEPWRIAVPHEKIQARWIRQVKSMSILRPPSAESK
jgi:hypothetical protein